MCGAPLHAEQEWCLNCGAAARTRLAASPTWKGLVAALAVVIVLSLGVLAAALVKLAGGSGTPRTTSTRTVFTTPAALTLKPGTSTRSSPPDASRPATGTTPPAPQT